MGENKNDAPKLKKENHNQAAPSLNECICRCGCACETKDDYGNDNTQGMAPNHTSRFKQNN